VLLHSAIFSVQVGQFVLPACLQRARHFDLQPLHDDCAATSMASVPSSAREAKHETSNFFMSIPVCTTA
jgi:hypothetical protein